MRFPLVVSVFVLFSFTLDIHKGAEEKDVKDPVACGAGVKRNRRRTLKES